MCAAWPADPETSRLAARWGKLRLLRTQLEARPGDVDAPDHSGWTALMEAAVPGQEAVVQTLLAAGADVDTHGKRSRQHRTDHGSMVQQS